MNFLSSHRVEALISYHSAALGVFPGGEPWEEVDRIRESALQGDRYSYPPIDTGCIYTGTLADYAVSLGAVAVDMELRNHRRYGFSAEFEGVENTSKLEMIWVRFPEGREFFAPYEWVVT